MANNCLVTKLKGAVNSDLDKLGVMTFIVSRPSGQTGADNFSNPWYTNLGVVGYVDGIRTTNPIITQINDQAVEATNDYDNSNHEHYENGVGLPSALANEKIRVKNYYRIVQIALSENITTTELAKLKYVDGFTQFNKRGYINAPQLDVKDYNEFSASLESIGCIDLLGNVDDMAVKTSLITFNCEGKYGLVGTAASLVTKVPNVHTLQVGYGITGNFADFGALTSLTTLASKNATGRVEDFVATARAAGRTSGSVTLVWTPNITFQDQEQYGTGGSVLSWTPTTITFDGVTIDA